MLAEKSLDKPSRYQAKEKPEISYFGSRRLIAQKPLIRREAYYTTAYLDSKVQHSISNIEQKVKNIQRQRRLRGNQFLDNLRKAYAMPDSAHVSNFLNKHPDLMDFALEAAEQIRKYFSSEGLSLEVVSDPEIFGNEELFIYIETSLPAKDALERLDEFDDQWFVDQLHRTSGLFNFNLRFV